MLRNIFILVALSSFACFIYGIIYIYYWDIESNTCHMTYMYGYPQYMKIDVRTNEKFTNYGLYYYYEGKPIGREEKLFFDGAPLIFIPGNAGSHKQVRSLASVALRKSMDYGMTKKLDYFSIDYNEELTGLHGGFLEVQKSYLKKCISAVLNLYKSENKSKIILIGHSMGGIVARTMLADKDMIKVINTIIFISTPLSAPVVNFDRKINEFYEKIDMHLNKERGVIENAQDVKHDGNDIINNILLVSIGGGNRDLLVYEGLTMSKHLDLHAMTASIPDVWLSCDHLSATWCLELMKVINRFLFSILSTEQNTPKIQRFINDKSLSSEKAYNFFAGKYFDQNVETFSYNSSTNAHIWHEDNKCRFTENYKYKHKAIYFKLIPVVNLTAAMYASTNVESKDWIYGCWEMKPVKDSFYCAKAVKLSNYIYRIPNTNNQKQFAAYLDFATIPNNNWTHVVLRIPTMTSYQKLTTLSVDIHNPKERIVTVETKYLFTLIAAAAINTTQLGATYYRLILPNLTASYQSLKINIHAQECTKEIFEYSAKIFIPWAQGFEKYFQFSKKTADFIISVPINAPKEHNTTANPIILELFLDSGCQFSVSYQTPFGSIMARIVRLYYGNIPSYITAMLLFALALQLTSSSEETKTPFKLLYIATSRLFLIVLTMAIIPLGSGGFPKSVLLTFILYGTAFVISALIVSANYLLLLIQNFLANKLKFLAKFSSLGTILHIIAAALFGVSFYFSGGLALWIGLLFYFINSAVIYRKPKSAENYEYINRQTLLCVIYFMLALLNLPVTIATLKSWKRNPASLIDPTFIPALIVIACLFVTWQLNTSTKMRSNKTVSGILLCCTFICITYCQDSVYRLSFIISFVFVLMLTQHILSIFK